MTPAARAAALAAMLAGALAATGAAATEAGGPPRDPDFGVVARGAAGLERRVAMYQWHREGTGYRQAWNARVVDSSGFVPGHENPGEFPIRSRRWVEDTVTVEGHPVAPEAVEALGRWEPMRPDFSALPGNLSATFQPEGDGLGSAENPTRPEIGDLRVEWRELRLPAAGEALVLRDGRWELRDPAAVRDAAATAGPRRQVTLGWVLLGMAAGLVVAVLVARRRRR